LDSAQGRAGNATTGDFRESGGILCLKKEAGMEHVKHFNTPLAMRVPQPLETAIADTAGSLARTFKLVGSLNGFNDRPMPERNTVVHLAARLIKAGFAVYAEPALPRNGRRIDLLASNSRFTFIFEVSTFGKANLAKVRNDVKRLLAYDPQTYPRESNDDPKKFWNQTVQWGAVLIQSFQGEEFNNLWRRLDDDDTRFSGRLKGDFKKLAVLLRHHKAHTGIEPICQNIWLEAERLDLLWAAFPLDS
jgi:hypothetical protein